MSIGPDLLETLELGTAFTILRDAGNITGEYADVEINQQVTKPFIREFFLQGSFAYNTQVTPGDVLELTDGRFVIVMNKTPEIFENTPILYNCVLFKSNVTGTIKRPTEARVGYKMATTWATVKADCYGLMTESLYGNELETDELLGQLGLKANELYIPSSYGIGEKDRFEISSSEYYRVEAIKTRRYESVDLCDVGEDTR